MTAPLLTVSVEGKCIGQGSLASNGHGSLYYPNAAELKPWRLKIGEAVKAQLPENYEATLGPVGLNLVFVAKKPKSRAKETYKTTAYDLDKLCRAVCDSLTKIVYHDDSQVCELHAVKVYEGVYDDAPSEGLVLRVWRL